MNNSMKYINYQSNYDSLLSDIDCDYYDIDEIKNNYVYKFIKYISDDFMFDSVDTFDT